MRTPFVPVKDCTCSLIELDGVKCVGKQPDCPKHGFEAVLKAKGPYIVQEEGDNTPETMQGIGRGRRFSSL